VNRAHGTTTRKSKTGGKERFTSKISKNIERARGVSARETYPILEPFSASMTRCGDPEIQVRRGVNRRASGHRGTQRP
jgi:hypothetical protein